MASNVRITGLSETVRSLKRFGVEVADLKAAFTRIGNIVVNEAQSLVPVMTGRLAASIRASKTQNKSEVRAGSAGIPYAGVQHYGGYNGITGSFFLTQAVANKQGEAVDQMETELNSLIRRLNLN
jgi:hypothetical protein